MKYYSEETKKFYESVEDCEEAEAEFKKEKEEKLAAEEAKVAARKEAAHDVQIKQEAFLKAKEEYCEALKDFCCKYGAYHTSLSWKDISDCLFNSNFLF